MVYIYVVAWNILGCFNPTLGDDPIWRAYISDGLVQPPTSMVYLLIFDWIYNWYLFELNLPTWY